MELAVRLLRIPLANLAARGLGNCNNGSGIRHGVGFGIAGELAGALAAAERKLTRSNAVESHSSRKSTTIGRRGNSLRSFSTRRTLENGGTVMRTRSMFAVPDDAAAARVSTGSHVTCGSGSRMSSQHSLEKVRLAGSGSERRLAGSGFCPVISLLMPFLMPKGRSSVMVRWTVDFGWNLLEQRRISAHGGRIASGEHVEPDSFSGKVAREACCAHDPRASRRRKRIGDQQHIQRPSWVVPNERLRGRRDRHAAMNQRVDGLVHLPGSGPMDLDASSVCFFREPAKEVARGRRRASGSRFLSCGAMGVELQEEIVADRGSKIEPMAHSRGRGHVVAGNLAGLQARHQPSAEAQAERPGDHQQVALSAAANGGFDPAIEGPWAIVGIIRAPIDLVHDASLGRAREETAW